MRRSAPDAPDRIASGLYRGAQPKRAGGAGLAKRSSATAYRVSAPVYFHDGGGAEVANESSSNSRDIREGPRRQAAEKKASSFDRSEYTPIMSDDGAMETPPPGAYHICSALVPGCLSPVRPLPWNILIVLARTREPTGSTPSPNARSRRRSSRRTGSWATVHWPGTR